MEFYLREWKSSDAQSICQYANNPKIAARLRDAFPYPYTEKDAARYIAGCIENPEERQCCRAIVVDGQAVGSIGIFLKDDVYRKSAELGYWLGEPFWNHGIVSEAIRQICGYAFKSFDIVRIFAQPYAGNAASRRVLEKAGFNLEGILKKSVYKNGQIIDSCIYGLTK